MSGAAHTAGPRSHWGWWAEFLALGFAYYVVGKATWLLGGPGQAIALWPPAGLALGVLLLRGVSLWPAVFAGAFGLMMQAVLPLGIGWQRAGVIAAGVAAGAALGPLLAALLVRRFVGSRSLLKDGGDVARFALFGGPGPALLSTAIAHGVLSWSGLLRLDDIPGSALVWWAGDLLGLLLFGPLVLLLGTRGAWVRWSRKAAVAVPVIIAVGLVLWMFVRANRWDRRRADAVVQHKVDAVAAAVQRTLVFHLDALRSLADFVGASGKVDAPTFQRLSGGAVVRHFAFEALAWAPAPLDNKPMPITQVEPRLKHQALVGVDLAADAARKQKLSAARQSGEALAVDLVTPPDPRAVWLFIPAPGRSGEGGVEGFLGAVIRMDVLVDRAIAGLGTGGTGSGSAAGAAGVGLELRAGPGQGKLIHRAPASLLPATDQPPRPEVRLTIADRGFSVIPVVSRAAASAQRSPEVWVVLVSGMAFVVMLQCVLLVVSGRSRRRNRVFTPEPSIADADDIGAFIDDDTTELNSSGRR